MSFFMLLDQLALVLIRMNDSCFQLANPFLLKQAEENFLIEGQIWVGIYFLIQVLSYARSVKVILKVQSMIDSLGDNHLVQIVAWSTLDFQFIIVGLLGRMERFYHDASTKHRLVCPK